ncbi:MAG: ribosome maturation factor RimM [Alphaproteobacteria bacterium]|nr:ribosome maturation factor RimM [Alphaproteobacteria bacterium]
MDPSTRILVGQITKAHGLKGEVKVKSFTADPFALASYGPVMAEDGRMLSFQRLRTGPGALLARFEGVDDRNAAEAIEGLKLYVARAALPEAGEAEYYHADLIGLRARDDEGAEIGRVAAVYDFGAGDVIEIAREGEKPLLLPFTDAAVPIVDLEGGFVRVHVPKEVA